MELRKKLHLFLNNKGRNYAILTQVINALIALVTGKLIAVYISPEDLGSYNLQWAAFIFFSTIFIVPLIQYIKATEDDILNTIGIRHYISSGLFLISATIISLFLILHFLYDSLNVIMFFAVGLYVPLYTANTIIANHLNIKNRIAEFCVLSIIKVGTALLCLLLFIYFDPVHVLGFEILWLMQVFGGICGIIAFKKRKYKLNLNKVIIPFKEFRKTYFKFAGPLMFMAFWAWVNNYFDRYAIEYFLTLKDVGVYNASYGLGSKFFLMLSPIFMILLNPIVFGSKSLAYKKMHTQRFGFYYFLIAIPILLVVFFFYNFIGNLLLSQAYSAGYFIIFLNAIAFFVFTLTQMIELIFYSQKRTKVILIGNIVGAIVNVTLNIILIPKYHIFGAAMATLLGFVSYFIVICIYFRSLKKQNV